MRTVTIVGLGRVGGALAIALARSGFEVKCLVSNDLESAKRFASRFESRPFVGSISSLETIESDLLFVTTQDSKIRKAAAELAAIPSPDPGTAFHASGALSSLELKPLAGAGWNTGSFHPLVSVNDPERGAASLKGAYFGVEGDDNAVKEAKHIAKALGGVPFEIGTQRKTLYHAAAVVACGHLVALIDIAQKMLVYCGLGSEEARRVLIPLIESTVANLRSNSPAEALTGPFARADGDTIKRHLQEINEIADKDVDDVYRLLGLISTEIAASKGADGAKLAEIRESIKLDKNNPR